MKGKHREGKGKRRRFWRRLMALEGMLEADQPYLLPTDATRAIQAFHANQDDPKYNAIYQAAYKGAISWEEADRQILRLEEARKGGAF